MTRSKSILGRPPGVGRAMKTFAAVCVIVGFIGLVVQIGLRADETGRWKDGGPGNCYWDENDEGPDQCDPNAPPSGRWKIGNGSPVCYWETNDSGPDQCTNEVPVEVCGDSVCSINETAQSCSADCESGPQVNPNSTEGDANLLTMVAAMQASGALTGNAEDMETLVGIFEQYGYLTDDGGHVDDFNEFDTPGPMEGTMRNASGEVYWMFCATKNTKLASAKKTLKSSEKLIVFLNLGALIPRLNGALAPAALIADMGHIKLRDLVQSMQEWPCAL